jgi:C4-dicarboxylate transporter DctQ subunit
MSLTRVLEVAGAALRVVVGVGFLFALGLNFANVVMRYVFSSPIFWAEEAMIFVFAWCVFLSAALVALNGEHLSVELLGWILPPRVLRGLKVLTHVAAAAVMGFVAYHAWTLVALVARLGQTSIIGEFPMAVAYGSVLAGCVLIVIASLLRVAELAFGLGIGRIERKVASA